MNETMTRSYGSPMVKQLCSPADQLTLTAATDQIEKGLYEALSRISVLDVRLSGPMPGADAKVAEGSNSLSERLQQCAGLVNRLHIGLSAIEQRIG